jgi:hypothetical protein
MKPDRTVMLNSFQHPGAVIRLTGDASRAEDRAWILKHVQDDEK